MPAVGIEFELQIYDVMECEMKNTMWLTFKLSFSVLLLFFLSSAYAGSINLDAPLDEAKDFYRQIRTLLAVIGLVITTGGLFTGNSFLKLAGGFVMAIFAAVFLYDVGIAGYLENASLATN